MSIGFNSWKCVEIGKRVINGKSIRKLNKLFLNTVITSITVFKRIRVTCPLYVHKREAQRKRLDEFYYSHDL